MFKFLLKISLIGILFFGLTTACTEEGTIGGGPTIPVIEGPSIGLITNAGFISTNTTVPVNSNFTVRVSTSAGDAALNTFTVLENGAPIDFNRIQVSEPAVGSNPVLILNEAWQIGFTWDITFQAAAANAVNNSYSFEIRDENDNIDVVSVNVTTEAAVVEIVGPTAEAVAEGNFITGSAVFPSGVPFEVLIDAQSGSSPIQSLTVLEDNVIIDDLTRLRANDQEFPANPWVFTDGLDSLNAVISIRNAESGDHLYEIIVTDANGEASTVPIEIFGQATGTSLTNSLTGRLLFNQAGPAGTGGINLFSGESVGSSDASAHLRDEGIDLSVGASINWNQQISGANNSIIRLVNAFDQPEGFSFEGIQFQEEIQELFATGQDLTLMNDAGRVITPFVIVGDIFAVQNGGDFFLVQVTNIVVSDDTNDDFYELSIKY